MIYDSLYIMFLRNSNLPAIDVTRLTPADNSTASLATAIHIGEYMAQCTDVAYLKSFRCLSIRSWKPLTISSS